MDETTFHRHRARYILEVGEQHPITPGMKLKTVAFATITKIRKRNMQEFVIDQNAFLESMKAERLPYTDVELYAKRWKQVLKLGKNTNSRLDADTVEVDLEVNIITPDGERYIKMAETFPKERPWDAAIMKTDPLMYPGARAYKAKLLKAHDLGFDEGYKKGLKDCHGKNKKTGSS